MILVDTSIWIDHFRAGEPALAALLDGGRVLGHPWVTGELALGRLAARAEILRLLGQLPQAKLATDAELLGFVEREAIFGMGIGYVDAQLLAGARLTSDTQLWTRDLRLHAAAERLGVASAAA